MFEKVHQNEIFNRAFALLTITSYKGIVPRKEGRMAVFLDGTISGTIGGGETERLAIKEALSSIKEGRGKTIELKVKKGGEITVHIDIPIKDRRIFIIGSGHIARALAYELYNLEWSVNIIDDHKLDESAFPPSSFITDLNSADINENSAVVITDPEKAELLLPYLSASKAFYIGLLTSRKWNHKITSRRIHAPVGLSLGAESPKEIALSIAAEILASFKHASARPLSKDGLVVIRGAGDLATGVAIKLWSAGYKIVMLDIEKPTVIRRTVAFAEAFYSGECIVEGVKAKVVKSAEEAKELVKSGIIPLLADSACDSLSILKPIVLIDAIIAKKNLGTNRTMAPFTVALGPGFRAGVDVDVVVETKRGHRLGTLIREGSAIANSGIPGIIGGYGKERVLHSENAGVFEGVKEIGDIVKAGDVIAYVDSVPVIASIDGKLRGLLHSGLSVPSGFKIADIDPRGEEAEHLSISDKARALGGAVLEAVDSYIRADN